MRAARGLVAVLRLLLVVAVLVSAVEPTEAACTGSSPNWSATPDFTSVNSCVSSAVTGDTVAVSAGSATWTSTLSIVGKSIVLRGAGIDQTIITDGTTKPARLLEWTTISAGAPRITGFTFDGGAGNNDDANMGMMAFVGNNHSFRFDHNKIITRRTSALQTRGFLWGVFDSNQFVLTNFKFGVYTFHDSWNNIPGYADGSYADSSRFGTGQFIFFEDNTYSATDGCSACPWAHDGWAGGRVVIRMNTFSNTAIDMHGTESSGRLRGIRAWEVYGNTFTANTHQLPSVVGMRGGTGLIFDNAMSFSANGFYTRVADLVNYRSDPNCTICGGPWGLCTGSSPWDQNAQSGYACLDQVGRGSGALLSGDAPSPIGWPGQVWEPAYAWNNTRNGALDATVSNSNSIQENRDFYNQTVSFNGTSGVGRGPIASRPASCTTGVGYWATDEGEWNSAHPGADGRLYKCTATNTWTLYYTPFTYPHPLRSGGSSASPSAPFGLITK